uniref:PKD_channel domain-containing protein n=1 Tax=Macrostomum lignano TaxID=282301 RepID=A0A1I8FJ75_9PLAT
KCHQQQLMLNRQPEMAKASGCFGGGGWWRCLVQRRQMNQTKRQVVTMKIMSKATLRELVIYCCFLVLMTVVAFGTKNISMFQFSNGTKLFAEINSIQEWWSFVNGPLLDGLFSSSGQPLGAGNATARSTILLRDCLLGVAQIRQVRVGNRTCKVAKPFRGVIGWCHG